MMMLLGSLFLIGSFLASASCLRLGAKLARIPNTSFLRAIATTLVTGILSLIFSAVSRGFLHPDTPPLLVRAIDIVASVVISWWMIQIAFRVSWPKSIIIALPAQALDIVLVAFVFLVMRPYMMEAYIMPVNAMSPTLLGPHQQYQCPHCGQTATVPFTTPILPNGLPAPQPQRGPQGICQSCQQTSEPTDVVPIAHGGDRLLVNKMLTPQRWDLVIFRDVKEPSNRYVKRLVGLPGEEVVIKDGDIWINGVKPELPPDITKLRFDTPQYMWNSWGTSENPARLGQDEYFVIGDFALWSSDSREWGPLPGKNIEGVVSVIYWPQSRWRIIK